MVWHDDTARHMLAWYGMTSGSDIMTWYGMVTMFPLMVWYDLMARYCMQGMAWWHAMP